MVFLLYIIGTLILIFSLIMGFKSGTTLGVFIGLVFTACPQGIKKVIAQNIPL